MASIPTVQFITLMTHFMAFEQQLLIEGVLPPKYLTLNLTVLTLTLVQSV